METPPSFSGTGCLVVCLVLVAAITYSVLTDDRPNPNNREQRIEEVQEEEAVKPSLAPEPLTADGVGEAVGRTGVRLGRGMARGAWKELRGTGREKK